VVQLGKTTEVRDTVEGVVKPCAQEFERLEDSTAAARQHAERRRAGE